MKNTLQLRHSGACTPAVLKSLLIAGLTSAFGAGLQAQTVAVDSTFGVNGYIPYGLTGNFMENKGTGNRSVLQPDGKILVAMDQKNPNQTDLYFYTYRYNPDGTPDASFGSNGVSRVFTGNHCRNKDIRVLPDGKIIVTGQSEYCVNGICGAQQLVVMRLKANGEKDSTFGTYGTVLTDDIFGSSGTYADPQRVIATPDGKYLLGGKGNSGKPFVARLNYDGSNDVSFATQGVFSDQSSYATLVDMVTDNTGNIYALMKTNNYPDTVNPSDTYVFRLTPNGALDNSYGTGGRRIVDISANEYPTSFALRSDNKLVIAGYVQPENPDYSSGYGQTNEGYVALLETDGTNSSVIPQGYRMLNIPGDSTTFIHTVTVTSGDSLLIGGRTIEKINGNYHEKAFVAHLDETAEFDTDFNGNGYMRFDYGLHSNIGSLACFFDLDLLSDGSILATGYRNPVAGATKTALFLLKIKDFDPSGSTAGIAEPDNALTTGRLYPNPWNTAATLDFTLAADAAVSIALIDLSGKTVHTFLENNVRPAGNYSEQLARPSGVTGGTYFLVMKTETGMAASVKVVLD